MNELLVRVHEIALRVRAWAEESAEKRGGDDDGRLTGWCAIASAELHTRLQRANIPAEIHLSNVGISCHVYVVVDDHVVDVTASQFPAFKNETVLIKHQRELEKHWFYSNSEIFNSAKALRKNQIKVGWVKHQIAYG